MPCLKRCKVDIGGKDDGDGAVGSRRKSQKVDIFFPLNVSIVEESPYRKKESFGDTRGVFILPAESNSLALIREEDHHSACRNFSVKKYSASRSTLTSLSESFVGAEVHARLCSEPVGKEPNSGRKITERRKDYFFPEDFGLGDVVWAKSGKKYPAWPAIVINPMQQAPAMVLNSCIPGALCVMFFGFSGNGKERVYRFLSPHEFYLSV